MKMHKALVIDDDPEIRETVADILDSLGHAYDMATCQDEARRLLAENGYAYVLLDLELPVRPGRGMPRVQNGENLLAEIRRQKGPAELPVIVITGHGRDRPDVAVRVMKSGAVDFVTKPFPSTGNTLDKAIRDALGSAKAPRTASADTAKAVNATQSAQFAGGEMVFCRDRVELCGVTVVEGNVRMRRILELLREKRSNGKFVAYGGAKLAAKLQIVAGQNAIAEAVKDFRDTVIDALRTKEITCGRTDVILSGGCGYRLAEWIVVRASQDG